VNCFESDIWTFINEHQPPIS